MATTTKEPEHSESCCSHDDEDIEHKVEHAIKALPTLQQKVQAVALNGYLQEKKQLDKKLEREEYLIDLKHRKAIEPLLAKINEIVEGKRELVAEDFTGVESLLTEQELSVRNHYLKAEKFQDYWLKALKNCEFGFEITDKDEEILKFLERVESHKNEEETSLSVKFFFGANPFFSNTELLKEFLLEGEDIKKSYGDAIQWKEGKNVTVKIVKKKQKNKKTGEKKVSTKEVRQESFFHFFDPIDMDDDDEDNKDEDDEATDEKVEQLEHQHSLAECIYSDVIQNSLSLYLGLGGLADFGNLADLEMEDGEDEDDDEPKNKKKKSAPKKDDDEDSEKQKSKSKSKGKDKKQPKKGASGPGGKPEECAKQ